MTVLSNSSGSPWVLSSRLAATTWLPLGPSDGHLAMDGHLATANRGTLDPRPITLAGRTSDPSKSPGFGALRRDSFELPRTTRYRDLAEPVPGSPSDTPSDTLADGGPSSGSTDLTRSSRPCGDRLQGIRRTARNIAPCGAIPESPERRPNRILANADRVDRSVSAPCQCPCGHGLETTHRGYPTRTTPCGNRSWLWKLRPCDLTSNRDARTT